MIFPAVGVIHRGKIVEAWVGLCFFNVYFGFFCLTFKAKLHSQVQPLKHLGLPVGL